MSASDGLDAAIEAGAEGFRQRQRDALSDPMDPLNGAVKVTTWFIDNADLAARAVLQAALDAGTIRLASPGEKVLFLLPGQRVPIDPGLRATRIVLPEDAEIISR